MRRPDRHESLTGCLLWALGLLSFMVVGQANEVAYAYLGIVRLFSVPAFLLSALVLILGLRLNPRPRFGWPFGLLVTTMSYSAMVGGLVSAPSASPTELFDGITRLTRPVTAMVCLSVGIQALAMAGDLRKLATIVTCIAVPVVGFQVVAYAIGHEPTIQPDASQEQAFRFSGLFADPNVAAAFSSLLVCFGSLSNVPRAAKIAIPALSLAGVLVTFSRGGLVAYVAVVAVHALFGGWTSRIAYVALLALALGFVFAGIPWLADSGLLPPQASQHLMTLLELASGQSGVGDNSRGQLVAKAIDAIAREPLTGYGVAGYMNVLGMGPHNMLTMFALLAGLPAMLLYAVSLIVLSSSGLRREIDPVNRRFATSVAVWAAVMGLSLHTILHDKFAVLALVMACVASSPGHFERRVRSRC